jgi:GNAT superfamily N-acetyltransferase
VSVIQVRDGRLDDVPFILNSAMKSIADNVEWARDMPPSLFHRSAHDPIKALLQRCPVLVASRTADPDAIMGYLIHHPKRAAVMWMFVKKPMRRFGVAKALLEDFRRFRDDRDGVPVECPFVTSKGISAVHSVLKVPLISNPFLLSEYA